MLAEILRRAAAFASDSRGSVATTFAVASTVLVIGLGISVDMARWLSARHATSAVLDAAVLSGGRALQFNPDDVPAALASAKKFYDTNATIRVPVVNDSVGFVAADDNTAITVTGEAYMKTPFLAIAGIDRLPLMPSAGSKFTKAALSGGGRGGSNIEVAMMLDVTGSMCADGNGPCTSGTKIDALKSAAKDLVTIVVQGDQSKHTSRVAVVPFSTRIRVGPDGGGGTIMKALTNLNATWSGWYKECIQSSGSGSSEGGGNWTCQQYETQYRTDWKVMPCVTDRVIDSSGYVTTDAAPASGNWLNGHGGDRMTLSWDSAETAPSSERGLVQADPATNWNYDAGGACADVGAANQVMPLSADKSALKNRIDGLEAYGATAGALGTAWSWYMLSPNWSSIWQGASTPGTYSDLTTKQANGAPVLRKVAILMTDGLYNTVRGWKDQDQQTVSDHAKQLCTSMKAQGIEIFTVGFALDQLQPGERTIAEATLRSCGTDVQHFYQSLTPEQLKGAFRQIALKISALRLSQ